ncbi:MAG: hypothetical protein R3E01_16045 [Pirellulaceae bacterium]
MPDRRFECFAARQHPATDGNTARSVHIEQLYGGLASWRDPDNLWSRERKVIIPFVSARMKQLNRFAFDLSGKIWSLGQIAQTIGHKPEPGLTAHHLPGVAERRCARRGRSHHRALPASDNTRNDSRPAAEQGDVIRHQPF